MSRSRKRWLRTLRSGEPDDDADDPNRTDDSRSRKSRPVFAFRRRDERSTEQHGEEQDLQHVQRKGVDDVVRNDIDDGFQDGMLFVWAMMRAVVCSAPVGTGGARPDPGFTILTTSRPNASAAVVTISK